MFIRRTNITEIQLVNSFAIKTPPQEIIVKGFQAIHAYLKRLETGSVQCKRTKLLLVGLGGAGKTRL